MQICSFTNRIVEVVLSQQCDIGNYHSEDKHIGFLLGIEKEVLVLKTIHSLGRQMHVYLPLVLRPHGPQMILLQPEQQWLRNFNEPIAIDKNLTGRQTLMGGSFAVQGV
jgi:hypothetical protein